MGFLLYFARPDWGIKTFKIISSCSQRPLFAGNLLIGWLLPDMEDGNGDGGGGDGGGRGALAVVPLLPPVPTEGGRGRS